MLARILKTLKMPFVILGALGVAFGLLVSVSMIIFLTGSPPSVPNTPTAALTFIAGSTSTATPQTPTIIPSMNPQEGDTPTLAPGTIGVGTYVQISGTDGEGLNLRASPGLSAAINFLGYDSEVFEVREGPQEKDGYVWWYLVTPVDESRNGWAAASYLSLVANP